MMGENTKRFDNIIINCFLIYALQIVYCFINTIYMVLIKTHNYTTCELILKLPLGHVQIVLVV